METNKNTDVSKLFISPYSSDTCNEQDPKDKMVKVEELIDIPLKIKKGFCNSNSQEIGCAEPLTNVKIEEDELTAIPLTEATRHLSSRRRNRNVVDDNANPYNAKEQAGSLETGIMGSHDSLAGFIRSKWTDEEKTLWIFYKLNIVYMNLNQVPLIFKNMFGTELQWLDSRGELLHKNMPESLRGLLDRKQFPHYKDLYDRTCHSNQWEPSQYFIKLLDEHSHILQDELHGQTNNFPSSDNFEMRVRTLVPDNSRLSIDLLRELYDSVYDSLDPKKILPEIFMGENVKIPNVNMAIRALLNEIDSDGLDVGQFYLTILSKEKLLDEPVIENYQYIVRERLRSAPRVLPPEKSTSTEPMLPLPARTGYIAFHEQEEVSLEDNRVLEPQSSSPKIPIALRIQQHETMREEILELFDNAFYYLPAQLRCEYKRVHGRKLDWRDLTSDNVLARGLKLHEFLIDNWVETFAVVQIGSGSMNWIHVKNHRPIDDDILRRRIEQSTRRRCRAFSIEILLAQLWYITVPPTRIPVDELGLLYQHLYGSLPNFRHFGYDSLRNLLSNSTGWMIEGRFAVFKEAHIGFLLRNEVEIRLLAKNPETFPLEETSSRNELESELQARGQKRPRSPTLTSIKDHSLPSPLPTEMISMAPPFPPFDPSQPSRGYCEEIKDAQKIQLAGKRLTDLQCQVLECLLIVNSVMPPLNDSDDDL
ncbi:hypothetical protein G9A89_008373 [Geosiphon pyriformis]|nr:hypothetical protein G9A89_008373 [Geosiphon pyriformis]